MQFSSANQQIFKAGLTITWSAYVRVPRIPTFPYLRGISVWVVWVVQLLHRHRSIALAFRVPNVLDIGVVLMEGSFARVEDVADKSFDYIVVGGGTAGCVIASRLSEDPDKSVLLLEAGKGRIADDEIDKPVGALWLYKQLLNPEYDWCYQTPPQKNVNERVLPYSIGKGLGGCSNMNMHMWLRPSRNEIDDWKKLGNPGWGYDDLLRCIRKVENFHPPSAQAIKDKPLLEDEPWFGKNGPISISYCEFATGLDEYYRAMAENRGINLRKDAALGDYTGYWNTPTTVDPTTHTRTTSFKGYILPHLCRKNLSVLPEAQVVQVLTKINDGSVTAEGVKFIVNSQTLVAYAAKEVLLCAGAIKSPHILELSGIGNPAILKPLGIPVVVDLPGVGENLQDHPCTISVCYELIPDFQGSTLDVLKDPRELEAYQKIYEKDKRSLLSYTQHEVLFTSLQNFAPDAAGGIIARHEQELSSRLANLNASPEEISRIKAQSEIQLANLKNPNLPHMEFVFGPHLLGNPEPGKKYFHVGCLVTMPWSRGKTHISAADPLQQPEIDINVFDYSIDLDILVEALKWGRQLQNMEPIKDIIAKEVSPGDTVVTDEQIKDYYRNIIYTVFHECGTAAMLPRDKLGVVDHTLKVYGTTNIRVCDISIAPIIVGVHTQCTVYGIAERAAEIIKAGI